MLKVGITGGIGSGKTTVCALFELFGIPVYYADKQAKALMSGQTDLALAIRQAFGAAMYPNGVLDPKALSAAVFGKPERVAALNALVHPQVQAHAAHWMAAQQTPYALKEAALFFESGSYADMDKMIGVSAPEAIRIARSMQRSKLSREEVEARMAAQMDEAEKIARCDFVIVNDGIQALIPQVLRLDSMLRNIKA
ncbi:MAG: dephospho-CoA kinase [Bacteroidetes bacterium]|nr:dephospho-CoA kinase [Bacteroidota bacterium]